MLYTRKYTYPWLIIVKLCDLDHFRSGWFVYRSCRMMVMRDSVLQLVFEGVRGITWEGNIAVDDITYSPQPCPYATGMHGHDGHYMCLSCARIDFLPCPINVLPNQFLYMYLFVVYIICTLLLLFQSIKYVHYVCFALCFVKSSVDIITGGES